MMDRKCPTCGGTGTISDPVKCGECESWMFHKDNKLADKGIGRYGRIGKMLLNKDDYCGYGVRTLHRKAKVMK